MSDSIDSVFDKIEFISMAPRKSVPIPQLETVREFESSLDFQLPPSFTAFTCRFGAGELASFFRIFSVIPTAGDNKRDLRVANQSYLVRKRLSERLNSGKTYFIATDIGGGSYFWDLSSRHEDMEFDIYWLDQGDWEKVATSFKSFVVSCCSRTMPHGDFGEECWDFCPFLDT